MQNSFIHTERRRLVGCLELQVVFRKRATNYRALLRKMTYEDKVSYESAPPCMRWLRLAGSLKTEVCFAKEPYKRDDILQKRPIFSRSLLIIATPKQHRSRLIRDSLTCVHNSCVDVDMTHMFTVM